MRPAEITSIPASLTSENQIRVLSMQVLMRSNEGMKTIDENRPLTRLTCSGFPSSSACTITDVARASDAVPCSSGEGKPAARTVAKSLCESPPVCRRPFMLSGYSNGKSEQIFPASPGARGTQYL